MAQWHSRDSRKSVFQEVELSGEWLPVSAPRSRAEGGCPKAGRQQLGLARSSRVPSGGCGGVNGVAPASDWKPSPRASKARLVPELLLSPSAGTVLPLLIPLFPQLPCGPLSCHTSSLFKISLSRTLFSHIMLCLPLSINSPCATQISFLFPPFLFHCCSLFLSLPLGTARRNQITISM